MSVKTRLHLGSGSIKLPGFVNIDRYNSKADRMMDAKRLDYPGGSVDEIYTSHMIEHVNPRTFNIMLVEWKRVLKEGGRLTIRCPNILAHMKLWVEGSEAYQSGRGLNCILGMQNKGLGYVNRNLFTVSRLRVLVKRAGFDIIRCVPFLSRDRRIPDGDILCEAVNARISVG